LLLACALAGAGPADGLPSVSTESFPKDIYTEPEVDPDTLMRAMAGIWERGADAEPRTDAQTNGPQALYGLRYHTFIHKPGFHDQVGYWLWEPATSTIYHTLAIPRGQVAMASCRRCHAVRAGSERGSLVNGIVSNLSSTPSRRCPGLRSRSTPTAAGPTSRPRCCR
jgi:hypothetical protein